MNPETPSPYFVLVVGTFRVTADRLPVRIITAMAGAATSALGTWLFMR